MPDATLVTGGTGTLGRRVVRLLREAGHSPRVLSRHPAPTPDEHRVVGNLVTGQGVADAVAGVRTVVHCATGRHDLAAARNLIAAAEAAGVSHLVYVSIVGVDRVPLAYYRTKLQVEDVLSSSALPWTILRATQFHDLIVSLFRVQRWLPVLLAPARVSFQPIDSTEVAARLADLVAAGPSGRVPDIGGPQVRPAEDLAHAYLRARGRHRVVLPVRIPGAVGRGYRDGGHLTPEQPYGRITFEQFLGSALP